MNAADLVMKEYYLGPVRRSLGVKEGSLIGMVMEEVRAKAAADEAYLASLSDSDREAVLFERKLTALEARFRTALDFRPYYGE